MNNLKTVFLMTLVFVLFLFVGNLIGGASGMTFAFIMALVMNFGTYWFSDKIVLKMYGAKAIERSTQPALFEMVERLSANAGLPVPKVYLIEDDSPNAFATGRNPEHAAVAFTTGIMRVLSREELMGVTAHELAHIKNRDILIGTIVATFAGTITYIAQMAGWAALFGRSDDDEGGSGLESLFLMLLAPIAATLLQFAVSRSREFAADETGARIVGNPMYLASALQKLHLGVQKVPMHESNPATAHMFIVNPLSGGGITKLFSTHPPMEDRIERLKKIAGIIA